MLLRLSFGKIILSKSAKGVCVNNEMDGRKKASGYVLRLH